MRSKKSVRYLLLTMLGVVSSVINSCTPDKSEDPIPLVPFSAITMNLNLPAYQDLKTKGYMYLEGGVRGIILYRLNSTTYIAYERNCSFQPNEACATVNIDVSGLFMIDPCCGSTFDFSNGQPTGGSAWRPLRQYETFLSGTDLTITDTVIN